MKKVILAITIMLGALQADSVVKYDVQETNTPISKPNHPNTDIY
ncbi:hypothetical protein [Sulfurimonas denitrificans]|nr:hypothetical protein [Sulfurimonas denitrificans]